MNLSRRLLVVGISGVAALAISRLADSQQPPRPLPDRANVAYGDHPRQVLDFWKSRKSGRAPLVVFIHGGGFHAGSKDALPANLLEGLLKSGCAVMSINYRLSPEVHAPAHYHDAARALQFARANSADWGIDPARVASTGSSAGAGISLWLGFHDDLAEPASVDPIRRQSTRLTCMAVIGAQSTYDPRVIREWIGGRAHEHPALEGFFGLTRAELDSPRALKLYEDASPITHLTRDDPPVWAYYDEPRGPLPADARPGQGIHHINFGLKLREKMMQLGLSCQIRHKDEGADPFRELTTFVEQRLKP